MAMTRLQCGFTGCTYVSESESEQVALLQFQSHMASHQQTQQARVATTKQKLPPIERPKLKQDINEEEWNTFYQEWKRFRRCTDIPVGQESDQLFDCCEKSLGRLLLREDPDIIEAGEEALLDAMKKMAVIKIATSVRRTKLLSLKQDHGQNIREFYANVKAQASTCNFSVKCAQTCCANAPNVDYTPLVVKDILISGIADPDIRKDVLEWPELDTKSVRDLVGFIEGKETSKKAWTVQSSDAAGISGYKKLNKQDEPDLKKLALKSKCGRCGVQISQYTRGRSGRINKTPYKLCIKCHKEDNSEGRSNSADSGKKNSETAAIHGFISAMSANLSPTHMQPSDSNLMNTSGKDGEKRERRVVLDH